MRTFIAIDLDDEIKRTVSSLINELDRLTRGTRNVKWVKQEGMHLTLKFFGEISGEKIPEVENVLKAISERYRPFMLKLEGTGAFPPGRKNPRVLWIGIEEEETLKTIQSHLEGELEKLGFPRERRRFHPHLTLGRVKTPSHLKEILLQLEKNKDTNFGEMQVRKLTFFQSILKPSGAEYSVLSEFELR